MAKRHARTDEMLQAISAFAAACVDKKATVADVIAPILAVHLFEVDPRLAEAFADKASPPPPPVPRKETETTQARMRRGWCALFAAPWAELGR